MVPGTFMSIVGKPAPNILYIGNAGENIGSGGTGVTVTYNASSAAGDFLLLFAQCDDGSSISTPSGWTKYASGSVSPYCKGYIFYKFKTTDTTVFVQQTSNQTNCSVLTFRNVDTTSPINVGAGKLGNEGSTTRTFPDITTTVDGCFYLAAYFHDWPNASNTAASSWTNANIASGTELLDISTTADWDGGVAVWGGYKNTAGACGATTVVHADSAAANILEQALALTPA